MLIFNQASFFIKPTSTPAITNIIADVIVAKCNTKPLFHVAVVFKVPAQVERSVEGEFHGGVVVDSFNIQGGSCPCNPLCATRSIVHSHRCLQGVVGIQVVVCISRLTSDPTIHSETEHSSSDCAPLCLSHGHSQFVHRKNVGASHGVLVG